MDIAFRRIPIVLLVATRGTNLRSMPAGTLDQIQPGLAPYVIGADPNKRYWCYDRRTDRNVVLFAGWNNTSSKPE